MKIAINLIILSALLFSLQAFALSSADYTVCREIRGVWKNEIVGKVVKLSCDSKQNAIISTYHVTPMSYVLQQDPTILTADELQQIHMQGRDKLNINADIFHRTNETPISNPKPLGTALENCHVLAEYFRQHYGFFKLRGVGYQQWRDQCKKSTTLDPLSNEFLSHLSIMLNQFGDNHIVLSKTLTTDRPDYFGFTLRKPFTKLLIPEVNKYNHENKSSLSNSDYIDEVLIPKTHDYFIQKINPVYRVKGTVFWGPLKSNHSIVYLSIQSMNIDKNNIDELRSNLEKMVNYIKQYKISKIIIDIRFNQGGDDAVSKMVMSYFFDKNKIVYWEQTFYNGSIWTKPKPISVKAATNYIKSIPIIILVSPITASAAETFALGLSSLPHVKLIGDNTMGIFSDQFPRRLPNGWWVTLSNQKLLSADKKNSYEKIGLPVFEYAAFPFLSILHSKGDVGIQKAREVN